ncbi:MAG: penicillin-binding protein 1C [Aminobacterium sp.]|nr:penicillin-binding protein 1C [Aminobacterium sp.]MEA4877841.1 penicillin-binding protein 1C [Aminobacterium sp.]
MNKKWIKGLAIGASLLSLLWASPSFVPLQIEKVQHWPVSRVLLDRTGKTFYVGLSPESEWCIPIPYEQMSPWLPQIAVAIEDRKFWSHHGVDFQAIIRAALQNIKAKRVVSGASTITSQVIRLSNPRPRTILVKAAEFLQAMKLEQGVSKKDILEIYLNRAPFGSNIRGVEAASRMWFGKPASSLSVEEAALLIGMLRGPSLYRPDRNPQRAKTLRDSILNSLVEQRIISEEKCIEGKKAPLPERSFDMPAMAFHFAHEVLQKVTSSRIETTLDVELQNQIEHTLQRTLNTLPSSITGAALLIHNPTGNILAYVGNGRFGTRQSGSWIDCCQALRSPGSALKPFAYLEAFSRGILTPSSLLADTPLSFGGLSPRNFDLRYRGPVSARQALAQSLNVPAVRVLREVGGETLLQTLRSAGITSLNEDTLYYGDSLILGGCETTVMQMALAYETIANLGIQRPLQMIKGSTPSYEKRIFDEASSFLIADILKDQTRLLPMRREALVDQNMNIAFKTGTSYGLRDAWTAAYTPEYTIVVWFGDPAGFPNPVLTGLKLAAPTAIEMLSWATQNKIKWYAPPSSLGRRTVCALSGLPPSESCPTHRIDWYIPGISRNDRCSIHQMRRGEPVIVWPSELALMSSTRRVYTEDSPITITSPLNNTQFFITPTGGKQKIALRSEGASGFLFWYIDNQFFGKIKAPKEIFWQLSPGQHNISVMDEKGRSDSITIEVLSLSSPAVLPLKPLELQ